ncbi:MAG: FkbM family methyltransferase [Xanthobacteraceae bacterium]|jgi:FkbM family methyltransferase
MIAIARRALNAFALRFSEAEKRLAELSLVQNSPLTPGIQNVMTSDGKAIPVGFSLFNPNWLDEFGIVPTTIFDVGSYDAGDAIRFKQAYPDALVYAFEADPARFAVVDCNAQAFGVEAVNLAVSDHDGNADWFASNAAGAVGGQGSLFPHTELYKARYRGVRQTGRIKVQTTRLDSFCRRSGIDNIDFLHVDVEGAEFNVIAGLGTLRPAMLFIETISRGLWHGAYSSADVHRLLSRYGYVLASDFRSDRLYVIPSVISE